jgi:hypothetical protein
MDSWGVRWESLIDVLDYWWFARPLAWHRSELIFAQRLSNETIQIILSRLPALRQLVREKARGTEGTHSISRRIRNSERIRITAMGVVERGQWPLILWEAISMRGTDRGT